MLSLRSISTGRSRKMENTILNMISRKIAKNSRTDHTMGWRATWIMNPVFPPSIFIAAISASFEKRMPDTSPAPMENSAVSIFSHRRIFTRFRFPMPNILYSPNSFCLLRIRKEFV